MKARSVVASGHPRSASVATSPAPADAGRMRFPIWPRERPTAAALLVLVGVQMVLFTVATQHSFFATDDYHHFMLAQERHFFRYLVTAVLGVYPAPGHRLVNFTLQEAFPLNFAVARGFLLAVLAATTVLLGHLVRTLARSNNWWTIAILAPFAFSLTLVSPMWWWSNGLPVFPGLLFTVVALSAWLRAYTGPDQTRWVAVAVVAVAAAGGFYIKFLLIPFYLLAVRLLFLPRLLQLPSGVRDLWRERARWIGLAVPPAAFLAVFVLSGSAGRSASSGERPYLEYFAHAWFGAVGPVSFLNTSIDGPARTLASWAVVVAAQVLFVGLVAITWKRSSLAPRAWVFLGVVFLLNATMIGTMRLPGFGVEVAYELRYWPEVVVFVPVVVALALRQGEERRPELAWERTTPGRAAIAVVACLYAGTFAIFAPPMVEESDGVAARAWFEELREDAAAVAAGGGNPPIIDAETPEYVMPGWMAPDNRVSTVLGLVDFEADYNRLPGTGPMYLVLDDGRLAEAAFRPTAALLSGTTAGDGVAVTGGRATGSGATCLAEGQQLHYRPGTPVVGERLAVSIVYAGGGRGPANLAVETDDPDRPSRHPPLRPAENDAELVELGTSQVTALTLEPASGDPVCVERVELGLLETA